MRRQPSGAALNDALVPEHIANRHHETGHVHRERHMPCILAVAHGLFLDLKLVAAVDLRPARKPRHDVVCAVFVPLRDQIVLIPQGRPRADDAHLSLQNVEDLRELIQARPAQEAPAPGDKGIRRIQQMGRHVVRRVDAHRPELVDIEIGLSLSHTLLLEQHRAGRVKPDPDRQNGQHRAEHNQPNQGYHQVEQPLDISLIHAFSPLIERPHWV